MASNNGHHRNGTGNGLVHINGNGHRPEAATVGEHDPASSAGQGLLWDGLPPAVTGALGQPLDPALISQRRAAPGALSRTSRATSPSPRPTACSASADGATSWSPT